MKKTTYPSHFKTTLQKVSVLIGLEIFKFTPVWHFEENFGNGQEQTVRKGYCRGTCMLVRGSNQARELTWCFLSTNMQLLHWGVTIWMGGWGVRVQPFKHQRVSVLLPNPVTWLLGDRETLTAAAKELAEALSKVEWIYTGKNQPWTTTSMQGTDMAPFLHRSAKWFTKEVSISITPLFPSIIVDSRCCVSTTAAITHTAREMKEGRGNPCSTSLMGGNQLRWSLLNLLLLPLNVQAKEKCIWSSPLASFCHFYWYYLYFLTPSQG